jgi:lantibiotic leader peptide-processing serine protease
MRKVSGLVVVLILVAAFGVPLGASAGSEAHRYVVLYRAGSTLAEARAAVTAAGGAIVKENRRIGVATAISSRSDFVARVMRQPALAGATLNAPIGRTTADTRPDWLDLEQLTRAERDSAGARQDPPEPVEGAEPLSGLQWGNEMIHATVDGSYAVQQGSPDVIVGIIDTGIDGSHPDIAPNFNAELSRNFTTDIPLVDDPCEDEPDASCEDPADVDENGHGTHVAGIVGAALNGLGTAGVAPGVTLVNLRAGQDSGFFFLQETLDAMTYAGDNGIDVVNMSYFTDPWLYNCEDNPADSEEEQEQQETIKEATQRAIDYSVRRGVTFVAALGNEFTDLGNPTVDTISPDFPPGTERERQVDNDCITVPSESHHVISVSALGPSGRKSDFSNYGTEQTDVSAPGGWFRDGLGTPTHRTPENLILAPYPESLAIAFEQVDETGEPTDPFVVRDCQGDVCAYYQYLQGTSMASPHAAGIAALIVSEYGEEDDEHGGLTMDRWDVREILYDTATDHACPEPRLQSYEDVGRTPDWNALCEGDEDFNGFYGYGIVDALAAVSEEIDD